MGENFSAQRALQGLVNFFLPSLSHRSDIEYYFFFSRAVGENGSRNEGNIFFILRWGLAG